MAIGFYQGYFGIQTNSEKARRVLFSVWDNKDAEHDKDIKDEDLVTLVDKGEHTIVNSFGVKAQEANLMCLQQIGKREKRYLF